MLSSIIMINANETMIIIQIVSEGMNIDNFSSVVIDVEQDNY